MVANDHKSSHKLQINYCEYLEEYDYLQNIKQFNI